MSAQSVHKNGVAMDLRSGARTRRAIPTAALLAAALSLPLTTGRTGSGAGSGRHDTPAPPPSASAAPGRSPLAVEIDNVTAARPATGLDAADVVYAEQVEGGLSRLMAVYATRLPKTVGPVRSARESDLELLRQFARPTLAFSGAQRRLLPLVDGAPLRAEPPERAPGAYVRDTARAAPHNLYPHPAELLPTAPGEQALTTGFRYGPAPAGGTPTASSTVRYPAARFTFTWSAGRAGRLVTMDGTPAVTTDGGRLAPPTVVVQYVTVRESGYHDVLGNPTPYTGTVGSGRARVLRDGRSFDATWSRPAATDGTTFTTAAGSPLDFAKGQVRVVFAAAPD
ncbi:DUF3048 domain-containing protein [Streptomyces sp. LP11]|uniref:DUF3048 domain-containing protein n=1 Tax=Streptomyces pyxinicus TaxID=2970331 RepID=A0ABT2AUF8_9ACTN|nr:DUF3048 domain-containing protein [Streptomyces sp. LP11]MCS0599884.1 DUF3048 domain-containing protein [Streptomyces sp. LP11]